MKLLTLAIILFIIQISIGLFDNTISVDGESAVPEMYNSSIAQNETDNDMFEFISSPHKWSNTGLIVFWVALAVFIGGVGIAASFFGASPSDSILFAGGFGVLIGFGAVPIISLFNLINREVGVFACGATSYCTIAILFGALTAGVLGLAWFMACLKWWRTGITD